MQRTLLDRPAYATLILATILSCWLVSTTLSAATVVTGDVTPPLPWNSSTAAVVGNTGSGTLSVNGGSLLPSGLAYVGRDSTGTATITGPGSKWTNSILFVGFGFRGSGMLRVEAGGQVESSFGTLGSNPGSMGTATITGAGSKWTSSSLDIGPYGSGTLTVEDGGEVTTGTLAASLTDLYGDGTITATQGAVLDADLRFDATHGTHQEFSFGTGGTLTVDFTAGGHLGAGRRGAGTLTIADGIAISSSLGDLGLYSGSTGTATITGPGSQWTSSSDVFIGRDGSGTLRVEAGGQVESFSGTLGLSPGATGTATITGPGSQWTNSSVLYVGRFGGSGTLRVEASGQVESSSATLGNNSSSTGTATITGPGSQWNNDDYLTVGRSGTGTLSITDGGLVSVGGVLTIDYDTDGESFLNMASGGMLALKGNADDSLAQFLGLVDGTDAIRYWDKAIDDWTSITVATYGDDYTLEYLSSGDLAGYTLLTVGTLVAIPEPSSLALAGLGLAGLLSVTGRNRAGISPQRH